ncbi:MAG: 1-acyl-sn-glycerol-3-phosphate acyltransferase [Alcaligenaceae bacterium]|nr:1-acyl-sn-glycerol-3-phosphate acyltransferase [Alcaligenaceae bacterium]
MFLIRFVLRSLIVIVWILAGLLIELLVFPILSRRARQRTIQIWSRALLWMCGVQVRRQGRPILDGAVLWVINHVSWIDIFVLNALRPTSFIAKADIRRWPVIGLLVAWAGTLFIDRGHRQALRQAARDVRECFARGDVVGLFPEGTTSGGWDVLHFHSGLFEPAVQSDVPVQPVALRFVQHGRRTDRFAFVGEQTLVANLWILLGSGGVAVECDFLPPVEPGHGLDRGALAQRTYAAIAQAVRVSEDADQA